MEDIINIINMINDANKSIKSDIKWHLHVIHKIELYLEIHDIPKIIDVNVYCGEFRVFDVFIDKLLRYNYYGDYDGILRYFLKYDDLIITTENFVYLKQMFHCTCLQPFDIYQLFINNKSVKKIDGFKNMLKSNVISSIQIKNKKNILYIMTIPEYDMKKETDEHYHPLYLYLSKSIDWSSRGQYKCDQTMLDIIKLEIQYDIDIIQRMMIHKTFKSSNGLFYLNKFLKDHNDYEYYRKIKIPYDIMGLYESMVPKLLLLMIGHCDDYLVIDSKNNNVNRFFNITRNLPQEIQVMMANYVYNRSNRFISSNEINDNLHIIG